MLGGKNKQQHRPLGYTIIEVMIVLSVSGVMFLIAASFINGKQGRAAFTEGSNDIVSQMQKVVGEIVDGHYSDVPLTCGASGVAASGTNDQGQNPNCVFLGKIVSFYAPSGSSRNNYRVYSVSATRNITAFPNSQDGAVNGLTTSSVMPQSLEVTSVSVVNANDTPVCVNDFNVGFVQSLGTANGDGIYLTNAQQPIQLVCADSSTAAGASPDEASVRGMAIIPVKAATICLTDGSSYAQLLIGGPPTGGSATSNNDNQLNIGIQQLGSTPC